MAALLATFLTYAGKQVFLQSAPPVPAGNPTPPVGTGSSGPTTLPFRTVTVTATPSGSPPPVVPSSVIATRPSTQTPEPPADQYLSEITDWQSNQMGWDPQAAVAGTIGGTEFPNSISMEPVWGGQEYGGSWTIPAKYRYLTASIGISDSYSADARIVFRVKLNGVLAKTYTISYGKPVDIKIPLGESAKVGLFVQQVSGGMSGYDGAIWGDVKLTA